MLVSCAWIGSSYHRDDWPHWIDADHDCQETRTELLIATSNTPVTFKDKDHCLVFSGLWLVPYTGEKSEHASDLEIDHLVPLSHAHKNGGAGWTREQKKQFANDFENLVVADPLTNQNKSDQAPNEWMPPSKDYWCEYLTRWKRVKTKYGLTASIAEDEFIQNTMKNCH